MWTGQTKRQVNKMCAFASTVCTFHFVIFLFFPCLSIATTLPRRLRPHACISSASILVWFEKWLRERIEKFMWIF